MYILKGTAGFLQEPPRKESIEHDWRDAHGRDVDVSHHFYDQRTVQLECLIATKTEAEFLDKRDALFSLFLKPGLRRLTFNAHGERSYEVYRKECSVFTAVPGAALKGLPIEGLTAYTFTLTVVEPYPQVVSDHVFILTDDDRYIIC